MSDAKSTPKKPRKEPKQPAWWRTHERPAEHVAKRDFYLDFIRAEEALRGVAERDAAVQDVLRTIRGRIDQQLTEVENFTRDWDRELAKLKRATAAAEQLVEGLATACKTLKTYEPRTRP